MLADRAARVEGQWHADLKGGLTRDRPDLGLDQSSHGAPLSPLGEEETMSDVYRFKQRKDEQHKLSEVYHFF